MNLLLLGWFLLGCGSDQGQVQEVAESALPKVRTTLVDSMQFANKLQLTASLQGIQTSVLIPKSLGRVASVDVRIGDEVKAGQILLRIEASEYKQGLIEAKASYRLAKAQAKQAQANLERFQRLHKKGVGTKVQLEEVTLAAELATQQSNRAKAAQKIAQARLTDTRLLAPFDGIIIARNVERGELLGAAVVRPPLQIADLSAIRAVGSIGEANLAAIAPGRTVEVQIPALGAKRFPATIERINAAVDPVLRTVQFEARIDNASGMLKHGMSAQIQIESKAEEKIAVPRSALLQRKAGGAKIMRLDGDKVTSVNVKYERSPSDLVPITQGLSVGDKVVTAGHSRLKSGDRVVEITE